MSKRRSPSPEEPAKVRVHRLRHGTVLRIGNQYASLARPGRVTTGSVWDLLAVPLLLDRWKRAPSVLLLGVGGGSVLPLLRALSPSSTIVGVELDRDVVKAAREHFALDDHGIELIEGDALTVLRRDRRRFDVVIDDIYVHDGKRLRKPPFLPDPGLALAAERLREDGVLVSNVVEEAAQTRRALGGLFGGGLELRLNDCHNRILIGGDDLPGAMELRRRIVGEPLLAELRAKLEVRAFGAE